MANLLAASLLLAGGCSPTLATTKNKNLSQDCFSAVWGKQDLEDYKRFRSSKAPKAVAKFFRLCYTLRFVVYSGFLNTGLGKYIKNKKKAARDIRTVLSMCDYVFLTK